MSQATFDLATLIREADVAAAPEWEGAPLRYHEDDYRPAELDDAWERWKFEHGHFGCIPESHMWHRDYFQMPKRPNRTHHAVIFKADTRCDKGITRTHAYAHQPGELPGELMAQVICDPCQWHTISSNDNAATEVWHYHAFPGWRDLPVVPAHIR